MHLATIFSILLYNRCLYHNPNCCLLYTSFGIISLMVQQLATEFQRDQILKLSSLTVLSWLQQLQWIFEFES